VNDIEEREGIEASALLASRNDDKGAATKLKTLQNGLLLSAESSNTVI